MFNVKMAYFKTLKIVVGCFIFGFNCMCFGSKDACCSYLPIISLVSIDYIYIYIGEKVSVANTDSKPVSTLNNSG